MQWFKTTRLWPYYLKFALWSAVRILVALLYLRAIYAWMRGGLPFSQIRRAVAAQMIGVHNHFNAKVAIEDHLAKPSTQKIIGTAEAKRRRKAARRLKSV